MRARKSDSGPEPAGQVRGHEVASRSAAATRLRRTRLAVLIHDCLTARARRFFPYLIGTRRTWAHVGSVAIQPDRLHVAELANAKVR